MTNPFALFLILAAGLAPLANAAPEVLPPEDVFRYTAEVSPGGDTLLVHWAIEPGYYLYRKRLGFGSNTQAVTLGEAVLPPGKMKTDEYFGEMEIYRNALTARIPLTFSGKAPESFRLQLKSQGCADYGLCYPPQTWETAVSLPVAITGGAGAAKAAILDLLAVQPEFGDAGSQFLPPDEAFIMRTEMVDPYTVKAHWTIAEGYYLYREKFAFSSDSSLVQLGTAQLPRGTPKYDEHFGNVEVYYGDVDVLIPISRASPDPGDFEINANYQGCAEDGICYPPISRADMIILAAASPDDGPSILAASATQPVVSEQDRLATIIRDSALAWVLLIFFISGLGLAFTPCVLPMVPILSGIITGQGKNISAARGFSLSAVYVLGMALTYTVAGVVTAMLGQNLQAMFQHPAVIIGFSAVFVLLALAMLGAYELQMPAAMQTRLTAWSNRQKGGTLLGVGVMGILSALIVGPCVAAPLAGALIFIGQSGDPVRGGLALFSLSLGMGAPLLLVGASAGHILPRAGTWMNAFKVAMGILLLGVAVWMISRIVPGAVTLLLWAALALFTAVVYLNAFSSLPGGAGVSLKAGKALGLGLSAYAMLLLVGAATGSDDPLRPLANLGPGGSHNAGHVQFKRVKTLADLEREVGLASAAGRPVMLDFYADWCVSCKEMEKYTFNDESVRPVLARAVLLQADVTANDAADKAMLKAFGVYGPPTIAFYGTDGVERKGYRLVGFVPAAQFRDHASAAFSQPALAGR